MATKTTCTDGTDSRDLRDNLKASRTGNSRATRHLFSPRRLIGRNDMVVDLSLGKMAIPKEEAAGVIKEEKIGEELEDPTDNTTAVEDEEENVQVKVVGEEVDILENLEADEPATLMTCPCACWNKIESLEAILEEQGRQIQNLNNVVVGLLGKQMASEQVQRPQGKESVVYPNLGESQPTWAVEIESRKGGGQGANSVTESLLPVIHVHQRQTEIPSAGSPGISVSQSKNERSAPSATVRKESSRPPPSHPKSTGVSVQTTKDGESTNVKESGNAEVSGEKHACAECAKEGRQRFFSRLLYLRRHVREKHSLQKKKLHKCDTCFKTFNRKDALDHHIRIVHEGVRYQCTHCTGSYAHKRDLLEHEKVHSRGIPLIRCKLCGLDVVSDAFLKLHLLRFHGGNEPDGEKRPKRKQSGHGKAGAPPTRKKVWVQKTTRDCSECGKGFDCDASLRYHLHKKHGILQTGGESSRSDGIGQLRHD